MRTQLLVIYITLVSLSACVHQPVGPQEDRKWAPYWEKEFLACVSQFPGSTVSGELRVGEVADLGVASCDSQLQSYIRSMADQHALYTRKDYMPFERERAETEALRMAEADGKSLSDRGRAIILKQIASKKLGSEENLSASPNSRP